MSILSGRKSRWPLAGLLTVQLLNGIMLMPANNFFAIYLNEVLVYPVRQVAQVIALGQIAGPMVAGMLADLTGNYRAGFTVIAVVAGLGSLFFLLARRPQ